MRAHRLLILLAAVGSVLLAPTAAASAQPYPPGPPVVTVSAATIVAGGTVTFAGTGFEPGENISVDVTYISLSSATVNASDTKPASADDNAAAGGVTPVRFVLRTIVKTVRADANGAFSTTIELDRAGTALLTATGLLSGLTASATVHILAHGGALPTTGTNGSRLLGELGAGAVALLLGGTLIGLTVVRRRKAFTAAAATVAESE